MRDTSEAASTLAAVPVLICALANVVFDVSFAGSIVAWREANGGFLGVHEPRDLADRALHAFEVGELGESEYARHLRAQLLWRGSDSELVEIFGDAFGALDLDVLTLLGELRHEGWRLVGVMNTTPWHEPIWRELYGEILGTFDRVFTSTELKLRMPGHRFYVETLRQVPAEGSRLFVDHQPESVSAARSAGLDAHLFGGAAGMSAACQALSAPAL